MCGWVVGRGACLRAAQRLPSLLPCFLACSRIASCSLSHERTCFGHCTPLTLPLSTCWRTAVCGLPIPPPTCPPLPPPAPPHSPTLQDGWEGAKKNVRNATDDAKGNADNLGDNIKVSGWRAWVGGCWGSGWEVCETFSIHVAPRFPPPLPPTAATAIATACRPPPPSDSTCPVLPCPAPLQEGFEGAKKNVSNAVDGVKETASDLGDNIKVGGWVGGWVGVMKWGWAGEGWTG